jgi:surface antigen
MGMREAVSFERLMAYADGELGDAEARQVEAAVAADAELAASLAGLREQDALLRSAINPYMQHASTAAADAILQARSPVRRQGWRIPTAIAASIAGTLLAVAAGWLVADYRAEKRIAALEAEQAEMLAMVSDALEKQLSGESVSWEDPATGLQASVLPLRTFKTQSGQWCREYLRTVAEGDQVEEHRAVACRQGEGDWRDRLEIIGSS